MFIIMVENHFSRKPCQCWKKYPKSINFSILASSRIFIVRLFFHPSSSFIFQARSNVFLMVPKQSVLCPSSLQYSKGMIVSRFLVMLNLCFLDLTHTFLGQGGCPEPIRNHLCEHNDRHATQEYSGVVPEKGTLFIGFCTIKKHFLTTKWTDNKSVDHGE